ncbi:Kinase [Hexamita inflata]|uniref:CMGC CDK n=2 Tax=Hexamita inflata TaxID=28002 RepID=A0AA86NE85_9EUKA|nr:CMGC CDK [Hexamita inflata]CAI9946292.1 CMGC CDK [Hexamita inflata]
MAQSITIPAYCNYIEYIGSGSYGDVSKCYSTLHSQVVAVKRVKMENDFPSVPPTTLREISILKKLNQCFLSGAEYIVKLLDVNYDRHNLFLIFEYCETDLELYLRNRKLSVSEAKRIFKQLLCGLLCIHKSECVHRDIKPNNLLLKFSLHSENDNDSPTHESPMLKITDFGLARTYTIQGQTSSNVASLWYRAPELVLGKTTYGPEIDLWAAGCVLYKLLTGKTLFQVQNEDELLEQICYVNGGYKQGKWPKEAMYRRLEEFNGMEGNTEVFGEDPDVRNLLEGLLKADPNQRMTAEQALECTWFDHE